jgi:competence protein ComEA
LPSIPDPPAIGEPDDKPAPAPYLPAVKAVWPRKAQLAVAFLLGSIGTLLAMQSWNASKWAAKPGDVRQGAAAPYRVDLNQADRGELLQLPGVGPKLATQIEQSRQGLGGFDSVDALEKVPGIGPAKLDAMRPFVAVSTQPPASSEKAESPSKAKPIDLNRATDAELQDLPGIGPKIAQRIIDERLKRPFQSVDDLRRVSGIGAKTLERLRPFVMVQTSK